MIDTFENINESWLKITFILVFVMMFANIIGIIWTKENVMPKWVAILSSIAFLNLFIFSIYFILSV